ncbi:Iron-sulfur clusters transporter atm1, mitochondrial [Podila epicladia]|nr:Iron-sulfur clusters transporter atm1, mitochondrial [Podila epicladia]
MILPGGRLCAARPLRDLLGASLQHGHLSPGSINKPNVRWQSHSITRHLTTTPTQSRWKQVPIARSFTHASSPKSNNATTQASPGNSSNPVLDTSKSLIGSMVQAAKSTIKTPTSSTSIGTTGPGSGSRVGAGAGSAEAGDAAQNNLDWKIMKELSRYIWPKNDTNVKIRVVTASTLLVLSQLINIQVPFFFKEIVDNLNVEFPVGSTVGMVVGASIVGYGLARASSHILGEFRDVVFASVAQKAIRSVSGNVFQHLHKLDMSFHLARQTGGLSRAVDRGTKGIDFLLSSMVFHILPTAMELTMVCSILAYNFGPSFAMVTASTMAAYSWFTIQTTAWRTKFRKQANAADNQAATTVVDSLINFESVKYFNNEDFELKQYDASLSKYEQASLKIASSLAYLNIGQTTIFSAALTSMMYMAAQGVLAGTMTVGDVVMVNQLIFQLAFPLSYLGTVYRELRKSLIDMETMFSLQRVHSTIVEKPGATELRLDSLTRGGELRFEDVYFGYHADRPILRGVSFVVPAGKKVAIVGPSGCGKSTLLRLLFRFYDPAKGDVFIDNQNIRDVTLKSLRSQIAVVPQETALFNSTIKHNIQYGRVSATEEQVVEAAKKARIHDAIMALPDKYETKVGERGLMLSGGEKQRVALSRAILKNSPIMFFDEATSALDSQTEQGLLQNIRAILRERQGTSLFIAHRLRTISDADEIIVLKEGKIAERGIHGQLLKQNGLYSHMWENQEGEGRFQNEE